MDPSQVGPAGVGAGDVCPGGSCFRNREDTDVVQNRKGGWGRSTLTPRVRTPSVLPCRYPATLYVTDCLSQ